MTAIERCRASNTLRFLGALVLANAPFWLLGKEFFGHRALINLDIALALIVLIARPLLGIALLVVAWAADIVLNQSLVFHFATPLDLLRSLQFASTLQFREYLTRSQALLVLPFLASGALLLRLTRNRPAMWLPACITVVLLLLGDISNGSSLLGNRDRWGVSLNIAGSPIATMVALQNRQEQSAPLRPLPIEDTAQGLEDIPDWAAHHEDRGVLFVIVESLGRPRSPALYEWLKNQLASADLDDRFTIRAAEIPFAGATTSGELRSLCALTGSYRELDEVNAAECLPWRLRRLGWTTVGMHGFSGRMFDRRQWWPLTGLQETNFADTPLFAAAPLCGSLFRGVCDERLVRQAVEALEPGRRFVYLLTLNTHLPVEPRPLSTELASLCQNSGVHANSCQLTAQLGDVLRSVSVAVSATRHPPLVVIVGDHAPPFALNASREDFFPDTVPGFVLAPRE